MLHFIDIMIKASILVASQERQIFLFMQANYSNKQYCAYPWANADQSVTAFRTQALLFGIMYKLVSALFGKDGYF